MVDVRRVIVLIAALSSLTAGPAASVAQDSAGSGPNQVVEVNSTNDAMTLARSGVQLASTGADRVASTNLAIANAHDCTACEARAAAYQAVFFTGDPSFASPRNVAAATNSNCTDCASFAFAYQYAVDTGGPVRLSDAARDQIDAIRQEAGRDIAATDVTYDELDAQLHDLAQRFRAVIDADLRRTGTAVEARQSLERHDTSK
jgi:hypothetical protein